MTKKSEPVEPGLDGNNDTSNPSKNTVNQCYKFDFVLNNYSDDDVSHIRSVLKEYAKKYIIGFEVGEQGTPHLQCYVSLIKKTRFDTLNKLLGNRCSIRKCRNEEALIEYCKKDNKFESYGFAKPIKIISNLYQWQKDIENIFLEEPDDRIIYWFWEATGNIGKSAFVKYMVVTHKVLFTNGGKHNDLINLVFNNDMDKCNCVIWDLPRASEGNISYATLECVKNGMVCNTKYETGTKIFNPPHIFIFANYPPSNTEKLSEDRWVIRNLV